MISPCTGMRGDIARSLGYDDAELPLAQFIEIHGHSQRKRLPAGIASLTGIVWGNREQFDSGAPLFPSDGGNRSTAARLGVDFELIHQTFAAAQP